MDLGERVYSDICFGDKYPPKPWATTSSGSPKEPEKPASTNPRQSGSPKSETSDTTKEPESTSKSPDKNESDQDRSEKDDSDKAKLKPKDKSAPEFESSCLTVGQIFQMNDAGVWSNEKTVAMLQELKQRGNCTGLDLKKKQPTAPKQPTEKDNSDKSESKPGHKSEPAVKRVTLEWINQLQNSIHTLVNQERILESLSPLRYDSELKDIARMHSEDMVRNGYFAHLSPGNQDPTDRANSFGYVCSKKIGRLTYSGIAENIYSGWLYSSITYIGFIPIKDYMSLNEIAAEVVGGWMDSPGHRQNILTKMYDREGIGVAVNYENEELLVTQNFC